MAEAFGRLAAFALLLVAVPIWLAVRLRRRGSGYWWLLLLSPVVFVVFSVWVLIEGPPVTVERVDPVALLERVEGYTFEPLPTEVRAEVEAVFRDDPTLAGDVEQIVSRWALAGSGGPPVATVVVSIDPAVASSGAVEEGLARGVAEGRGVESEQTTISGENVIEVETRGRHVLVWLQENLFIEVVAANPNRSRPLAEALVAAVEADRP